MSMQGHVVPVEHLGSEARCLVKNPARSSKIPLNIPSTWLRRQTSRTSNEHPRKFEPKREKYHDPNYGISWVWTSRGHRKGLSVAPVPSRGSTDPEKGTLQDMLAQWRIKRQRFRWLGVDLYDISWWIAAIFTVGSVFWCINGIMFFCYFTESSPSFLNTEAAMAFIGGSIFVAGAYLGWVESLNPDHDVQFHWDVDEAQKTLTELKTSRRKHFGTFNNCSGTDNYVFPNHFRRLRKFYENEYYKLHAEMADEDEAPHHFHLFNNKPSHLKNEEIYTLPPDFGEKDTSLVAYPCKKDTCIDKQAEITLEKEEDNTKKWRWIGTYPSIGYVANSIQLFGALIFFMSTLCGLPGVLPAEGGVGGPDQGARTEGLWIGLYWATQVIGAMCFVVAGFMFCYEVQTAWWKPNLLNIGWQIGAWNIVGGFGFFFCGLFGIWRQTDLGDPTHYQKWGTAFSTFWGSWAFLIGSYIQLLECLNKRSDIFKS